MDGINQVVVNKGYKKIIESFIPITVIVAAFIAILSYKALFPRFISSLFFVIFTGLFLFSLSFNLNKGFLLFVALISIAPPLYLLLPLHSILRSIRLHEFLFVLIFIIAFMYSTVERRALFHKTPINIPTVGLVLFWLCSMVYGLSIQQPFVLRDVFEFLKPIRLFLIFQIVIYLTKERSDIKKVLCFLVGFSVFPQLLGIFEHFDVLGVKRFLGTVYSSYEYSSNVVGGFDVYGAGFLHKFRVSSIYVGDVNAFGGYSALFFLMSLILSMYVPERKNKILFLFIALLNLYGVSLSGSRKAVLCIILGLVVFIILNFKMSLKLFPLFIVGFFGAIKIAPSYLMQRLFTQWNVKLYNLILLFRNYMEFNLPSLFLGKGSIHEFGIDSFHLKLLLRGGLLSFCAYFVLIFSVLKVSFYVKKHANSWMDDMVGLMAIILIISVEWLNVTGLYSYSARTSESLWVVFGLMYAVYRFIKVEQTRYNLTEEGLVANRD